MNLIDIAFYLVNIATYSVIISVTAGIFFFNKLTKPLKILLAGLCVVLVLDAALFFFDTRDTNTFLYIFSAVDILTFAPVFALSLDDEKIFRIFMAIAILFIPLIAVDALFISGLRDNGYSNAIEKMIVLCFALYYLTRLFTDDFENKLTAEPMFWVSVGIISYDLVGFFDLFSGPVINYSQNLYLQYYIFWSVVTVFMYIAFAWSFRLCRMPAD